MMTCVPAAKELVVNVAVKSLAFWLNANVYRAQHRLLRICGVPKIYSERQTPLLNEVWMDGT